MKNWGMEQRNLKTKLKIWLNEKFFNMTSVKTRKIISGLKSKGFESEQTDHILLYLVRDGKKQDIYTKISRGEREYGDPLLSEVAKQLNLNKSQLLNLIECTMTKEEYLETLEDQDDDLEIIQRG